MRMDCWSRCYWVLGWWFWLWFFCFSYFSGGGGTHLFAPSQLRVQLRLFGSVIMKPCSVCFVVLVFVIIDRTLCLVMLVFFTYCGMRKSIRCVTRSLRWGLLGCCAVVDGLLSLCNFHFLRWWMVSHNWVLVWQRRGGVSPVRVFLYYGFEYCILSGC
jgi:hypothetical protein